MNQKIVGDYCSSGSHDYLYIYLYDNENSQSAAVSGASNAGEIYGSYGNHVRFDSAWGPEY